MKIISASEIVLQTKLLLEAIKIAKSRFSNGLPIETPKLNIE